MLRKATILGSLGAAALPFLAFAQLNVTNINTTIGQISDLLGRIVPIIVGLGLIYFLWTLVKFLKDPKAENRSAMIWGIVILVVMVSVWGLVKLVQNTFNVDDTTAPNTPEIPTN